METQAITEWTFFEEVPIPLDVAQLMVQGEQPFAAFKTFRDSAIFTSRRLIVRDAQGVRGKKVEIYSLPYSSVNMWSTENAGTLDWNAEVELWTRAGHIKIKLGRNVDVRPLHPQLGPLNAGRHDSGRGGSARSCLSGPDGRPARRATLDV